MPAAVIAIMQRRTFLLSTACAAAAQTALDFSALPNFCSHEHWGSIDSIGTIPGGYRADAEPGAIPTRRTGFMDLVLEPYFRGWLAAGGADLAAVRDRMRGPGWEAFTLLRPALADQRFTGVYQCTRRGILQLYGADLDKLDQRGATALDEAVAARYADPFPWYRNAMRQAHFSDLIRVVHPEFYASAANPQTAVEEKAFTHTVMRIDPLLELADTGSARGRALAAIAGVEPADAATWRAFLRAIFDRAAAAGALGIKQLQAYRRSLEYLPRADGDVRWSGKRTAEETTVFQDWVMHECCKLAEERGWPHQVHVGTNNLTQSSPMPLGPLAQRYRKMKIVMIHCWPFLREAGWLAKFHPNVYIDTCWQPVLNPGFFREAISTWWNYVPLHKITCGHDSTTVEMACGSALFTREILAEVLGDRRLNMGADAATLRRAATGLLHNNAVAIYGIGRAG
ncbi:MAG: amidohydrolase family protein [Bryobacteraceae bacterium]